jgi:hypothetical protein
VTKYDLLAMKQTKDFVQEISCMMNLNHQSIVQLIGELRKLKIISELVKTFSSGKMDMQIKTFDHLFQGLVADLLF